MGVIGDELGISSFPDHILCHILSFLPTKYAVKTSILARRWRFLWTRVVNLEFEHENSDSESEEEMSFSDFVDRVFLQHNAPSINSFSFSSGADSKNCKLDSWISEAIDRNVQVMDLDNYLLRLPECLFKCDTLVDLRLHNCLLCDANLTVSLPKVKKLFLDSVMYDDYESLPKLISGCLLLEDLNIHRMMYGSKDMVYLYVSSPVLRRLALNFEGCDYAKHIVELDTPQLQYLKVVDSISIDIYTPKLSSLVQAEVCLCKDSCKGKFIDHRISSQFFESFSKVKCLTLSSGPTMTCVYTGFLATTTRFRYLTKLDWVADTHFLPRMLQISHMLKILIIRKVDCDVKGWVDPAYIPFCLSSHIRTVSIYAYEGREWEYGMVSYILKNAEVLQQMNIYSKCVGNDSNSKFRAIQRISMLPRGSEKCELSLC
ncbi:F-box/FBD/LRR-repeat protein At5g56420-like [Primulina huaijiensis]|uniref:F-box/FBD/LRR-repeat protein At5g56420-like n=1 Tax=Primulina huaijiensis TaxID=1492673 RepID=UPI003CC7341B